MLYILTLTWNACDKLTKLHDSLIPALAGIDYQWIIKDNDSKDDTVAVANTWGDKVKVIKYPDNRQNFSQGVNHCFHEANPKDDDMVLLLNNDIVFNDTESLKHMIALLKDDVGVVGARLLFTGTNQLQHAGVVFDENHKYPIHFRAGQVSDVNAEKNRLFQVVTGALLLMYAGDFRKIFKNKSGIDGMDENYHWAFDDVDLCLSVNYNLKKKIVYCGKTNISHEESASLKKNPVNKMFLHHNTSYLKSKWLGKYALDKSVYEKNPKHNVFE